MKWRDFQPDQLAETNKLRAKAGAEKKRPTWQRILREIKRLPRNLRRLISPTRRKISTETPGASAKNRYEQWIREHEPGSAELKKQREAKTQWPLISLLIPVHDTPPPFLEELLGSLQAQTNENWEACLVDGGTQRKETLAVLEKWAAAEPRLRLQRLEQNRGVAENTNHALRMASGAYVALVDHDDTLAPFALFEVARAIQQYPTAEIFYSDEDRLTDAGTRADPFFKPEWSPALLLSFMYVGHLTIYKRDFLLRLGGFRQQFDLSQDYDLILRATECARGIVHIPHILYHWREHAASGACGGKPHARTSNLAALAEAMKRRGLEAEVREYPTANRAQLRLHHPRVAVIIPTDSPERARKCAQDLVRATSYENAEFIVVTNSKLIAHLKEDSAINPARVHLVAFDRPFNFSAKCNAGARATNAERIIFLNDDVTATKGDWIENVIEPLENPEVGAVAPKMLYENGRIQHAGLVTGVRGLIGTAAHQWPGASTDYANFAQSMRDVAALSAACLAMRRDDFFRVGNFDEIHTSIAHSDVDLCFKIRATGLRCVYTPFATMIHRGHASIGTADRPAERAVDKSSIYLLQRWANFTCHDPFFPDNMRDWLYTDSPTPTRLFARRNIANKAWKHDLLLVAQDLSLSDDSLAILEVAKRHRGHDVFVVVISPKDGPLRQQMVAADIPVIVDPLIAAWSDSGVGRGKVEKCLGQLLQSFDQVLTGTVAATDCPKIKRS